MALVVRGRSHALPVVALLQEGPDVQRRGVSFFAFLSLKNDSAHPADRAFLFDTLPRCVPWLVEKLERVHRFYTSFFSNDEANARAISCAQALQSYVTALRAVNAATGQLFENYPEAIEKPDQIDDGFNRDPDVGRWLEWLLKLEREIANTENVAKEIKRERKIKHAAESRVRIVEESEEEQEAKRRLAEHTEAH